MKKSYIKLLVLAFAVAMTAACGKKGSDGASVTARDARVTGAGLVPQGVGAPGTVATIQFSAAQQATITENARILVSATMDPQALGDVNSVEVSGNIGVQANGQISNDSAFQIVIRDQYVGTTSDGSVIEPVVIRVSNATGTAYNGQVNANFTDSYGTITLTGQWQNGGSFSGTVSFRNTRGTYNGKSQGSLGSFSISTCAFFRCTQ
jgi:hypothetical protein